MINKEQIHDGLIGYDDLQDNTEMNTDCKHCEFPCETIGYCLTKSGWDYILTSIFCMEKGYTIAREDWGRTPEGHVAYGIGMWKREAKKFMKIMEKNGHKCSMYQHENAHHGKTWAIVIIDDGVEPIDLAVDFKQMEAIA